ncbi:hypothetical protein [Mycolicibacterium lutetiense]
MSTHEGQLKLKGRSRIQVTGLLLGVAAVSAMAALAFGHLEGLPAGQSNPLAGSGDAPTNTMFTQPVVGPMKLGSTVTETTPPVAK